MGRAVLIAASLVLLAGCVPKQKPVPAPSPEPAPTLPVVVPPVEPPAPAAADWRDIPLTAGEWSYDEAALQARFLAVDGAAFILRCDPGARRVLVAREGGVSVGGMTIRTTSAERRFAETRVSLPSSDPFLDAIPFSRGRVTVETEGRTLVIPAWPEPAKAVEDCRG